MQVLRHNRSRPLPQLPALHVVVVGRSPELAQYTVDLISAEGGTAVAHPADVTKEADCSSIVKATIERYGRLDCLHNNVGGGRQPGNIVSIDLDTWRKMFALNIESILMMSKYAIPAMIETARGGSIVNISSLRAIRPLNSTAYTAAKGAVMALSRSMAVDHGPQGIRVNCLVVGPVFTPSVARTQNVTQEKRAMRAKISLLGIEGSGWDVGYTVRFLLSEQSRYLTGQCIVLDGGVSTIGPAR